MRFVRDNVTFVAPATRRVRERPIQVQVNTVGEDKLTLVKTLTDGVKIKELHAKTRMAGSRSI